MNIVEKIDVVTITVIPRTSLQNFIRKSWMVHKKTEPIKSDQTQKWTKYTPQWPPENF